MTMQPVNLVVAEILLEAHHAMQKFGPQTGLPDGTGGPWTRARADYAREVCQRNAADGTVTWLDVLYEEVREAFAESDPVRLRKELEQVAAVCIRWIDAIDERA